MEEKTERTEEEKKATETTPEAEEAKATAAREPEVEPEAEAAREPEVEPEVGAAREPEVEPEAEAAREPEARPRRKKNILRRRRRSTRRKNRKILIGLIILVLAAVVAITNLPYFNVQNISVAGNNRVEDAEIKRLSELEDEKSIVGLNSFLAPQKVKVNPYIETAKVKRKFPGTIQIVVTEKEPAAQLATPKKKNTKRKYVAVDSDGMVLEISEKKLDMTYIKDVDVTEASLRDKIRVKDEASYEKAMDIIATAAANDMYFMRITVNGSWIDSCIYDDLYCKGRYRNIKTALEEGTLRTVVYRLYQQNVSKGTINVADNDYCSFTDKT